MSKLEQNLGKLTPEKSRKETLKRANDVLAEIVEKYSQGVGKKEVARQDALIYAQSQYDYSEVYFGELEMPDGSEAALLDIEVWSKAIEDAQADSWVPMQSLIRKDSKRFIETAGEDDDWHVIGEALGNLADSILGETPPLILYKRDRVPQICPPRMLEIGWFFTPVKVPEQKEELIKLLEEAREKIGRFYDFEARLIHIYAIDLAKRGKDKGIIIRAQLGGERVFTPEIIPEPPK